MTQDALKFPPESAPRTIYVFLLDIDASQLPIYERPAPDGSWPLPAALGIKDLDSQHVEVFPEERISEYGLVEYLVEANGMSPESVAAEAPTLESLIGTVVMVHGKAVQGRDGAFDPCHPARFVGRFEEKPHLTAATPQPAFEVARGLAPGGVTPGQAPNLPWGILLAAAAAIVGLVAILWSLA